MLWNLLIIYFFNGFKHHKNFDGVLRSTLHHKMGLFYSAPAESFFRVYGKWSICEAPCQSRKYGFSIFLFIMGTSEYHREPNPEHQVDERVFGACFPQGNDFISCMERGFVKFIQFHTLGTSCVGL
jgi:hypothetical protein